MTLKTEYQFTLPYGYPDQDGNLHRNGSIRLATARDEVQSINDPRVHENEAYLPIILLSRVVTQLGDLPAISPQVIENLFAADLAYLEDLYLRLNSAQDVLMSAVCPQCSAPFRLQVAPLVGSAIPDG